MSLPQQRLPGAVLGGHIIKPHTESSKWETPRVKGEIAWAWISQQLGLVKKQPPPSTRCLWTTQQEWETGNHKQTENLLLLAWGVETGTTVLTGCRTSSQWNLQSSEISGVKPPESREPLQWEWAHRTAASSPTNPWAQGEGVGACSSIKYEWFHVGIFGFRDFFLSL